MAGPVGTEATFLSRAGTFAVLGVPALLPVLAIAAAWGPSTQPLIGGAIFAAVSFFLTYWFIPRMEHYVLKNGIRGKDLNKVGAKEDKPFIPESMGVVAGPIYIICIIMCQVTFSESIVKDMLVEYNAALHSICFMVFLGFADDVMDLPWRYKLVLPAVATLPLLVAYHGPTSVLMPAPVRFLFGPVLDLGVLYKVYMGMVAVFCTNAINIHAGLNGLEAGQSFVLACSVLLHNILELSGPSAPFHLFSALLMLPFIGCTAGLLVWNWYPSRVFVGDCYTNFAGMTLAVVGILGHFSKTLMLLFIPQIINFLLSLPQLFARRLKMVPVVGKWAIVQAIPNCPRHRLPRLNQKTGLLEGVKDHWNLVNVAARICGPMREDMLCIVLLLFQVACTAFAFFVRYKVAAIFY